ncbi:acetyl-CoA synthetase-like protein [Aureobasidium pullulans]|uniref:Acetyl-CoA synthetase-like protein n=1 Tax=Aureobasidium pullulans TaxID=5580 RepID=A0A4S8XCV5_AURPU|nr:acetyl-CoA synthetase-like protein [Aureobasidium pullulans]THW50120.1 acetyl-CoA synthetase-like protein [Aureobasidium pullulans]THY64042.1 acetyl-CoA synthetase-like protein [Aureobasidium pullulans]THZ34039.1 acetyl-CoA synthetase-like protein [Aureobasidium pullulans]
MPRLSRYQLKIPFKDVLSFCSETQSKLDQDKPVRYTKPGLRATVDDDLDISALLSLAFDMQVWKPAIIHYPILVQAIIGAGGVFVGTNPAYTPTELRHALETSLAKFIITEPELLQNIKQPAVALGISGERIFLTNHGDTNVQSTMRPWRTLLEHGQEDWSQFDDEDKSKTTNAMLLFSSGTTGLPKATQISHYNLVAQHVLVHENPQHPESYPVSRIMSLPMFHAAAAPYTHLSSLRAGYPRRFEVSLYLSSIERFGITSLMMVPPMVTAVIAYSSSGPDLRAQVRQNLQFVRSVTVGAAPLSKETQARMQTLLPEQSPITQVWAMSETSCIASCTYWPEFEHTGSVGRFLPGIDAKVVDESGSEVPDGMRGELCVRGPTITRGYINNPEARARDWDQDGYFHTGDIVYQDQSTELWYVVDRKKELIKVRGFQVSPAEIEAALVSHPLVQDVAVIGVDGGEDGELPRAYVIRKDNTLSESDLKVWYAERLARYKWLTGGVKFVDQIPRNASGKILKNLLREQARTLGSHKL